MSYGLRPGLDQNRAGILNRRVSLLRPNATPDATGFVPRDPMTVVRVISAMVEPLKGDEKRESLREIAERWATIRCYYLASKDVVEGWWIQHVMDGVTDNYDVRLIQTINSSRKMNEFTCRMVR